MARKEPFAGVSFSGIVDNDGFYQEKGLLIIGQRVITITMSTLSPLQDILFSILSFNSNVRLLIVFLGGTGNIVWDG